MIILHRLNGDEFVLNSNQIETVEERPDTVITLINEKKYIIKESKEEVLGKVATYQKKFFMQLNMDI